jgi:hypothetical protein
MCRANPERLPVDFTNDVWIRQQQPARTVDEHLLPEPRANTEFCAGRGTAIPNEGCATVCEGLSSG